MKNILIIQFRTDQSREQEQRCFVETVGSGFAARIIFVSAIENKLSVDILENVSHVILGGSGEFFLGQGAGKDSWLPRVSSLIEVVYARQIPIFGICFGHQILLAHAGAKIQNVPEMSEVGTFPVHMRDGYCDDELFADFPQTFDAIYAHKETPVDLPDSVQILGSTERVQAAVTRIKGRRAWSVMFHPDMNMHSVRERFAMFPHYAESPEKFAQALESFRDAPQAQQVILNFLKLV